MFLGPGTISTILQNKISKSTGNTHNPALATEKKFLQNTHNINAFEFDLSKKDVKLLKMF